MNKSYRGAYERMADKAIAEDNPEICINWINMSAKEAGSGGADRVTRKLIDAGYRPDGDGEMMNRKDMVSIAKRAARLAVSEADNGDLSLKDYYLEYMSQLQGGSSQCLRTWIGTEVENGVHEAIDILKLWIRAELRRCVR